MQTLWQDLRYGLRMLVKSPGFAAIAILTLALGIGANTAIFSLIDAILMRSLPVQDPQSLVVLNWSANKPPELHGIGNSGDCKMEFSRESPTSGCSLSEPFFHDVAMQVNVLSGVAAFAGAGQINLSGNGAASILRAQAVSGGFFPTLGIRAAAGRLIAPSDDSVSATPVVVLNYGYWKSEFGGLALAIGKTVRLNNVPFTIIGVAESRFDSLSPGNVYDAWVPLSVTPQLSPYPFMVETRSTDVCDWWLTVIGRLKPGVAREQAQAAVSTLFHNDMLHGEKPLSKAEDNPAISLLSAQFGLTGSKDQFSTELYVLMMAVGVVLLIACANVAGLLVSRATARQKEMAVRLALGAGRIRILRQLLTESLTLSVIGGALGVLLALWGTHVIVSLIAGNMERPLGFTPGIDGHVLAFTAGISILTGIIFGLAPAFRGMRVDLTPMLKEGSGGSLGTGHGGRWFTLGNALVVAQVALTIVVLVGAGLLVRTLQNLKSIDPGFSTRNVLTFRLDPLLIGYKSSGVNALYRNLQEQLGAIPGVKSVSFSEFLLLSGGSEGTPLHMPGAPKDELIDTNCLPVGMNFFSTMQMRLLAGRDFTSSDFAEVEATQKLREDREATQQAINTSTVPQEIEAPKPAVVNETFVRHYLPKVNPLGQKLEVPYSSGYEVIGVVNDAKYENLRSEIEPIIYVPNNGGEASFELVTATNPSSIIPAVRSVVNQLDNNLPLIGVKTETQQIDFLLSQERMIAKLSSFFGVLALVLACIGLYGLLSYEVTRRTREIGIRMALGAQRGDVLGLVVKQGIALALLGVAVGTGVALGVTRYLESMLYSVHANDPATMIAVSVLLMLVAFIACYIPARRATHVDPMVALRYE